MSLKQLLITMVISLIIIMVGSIALIDVHLFNATESNILYTNSRYISYVSNSVDAQIKNIYNFMYNYSSNKVVKQFSENKEKYVSINTNTIKQIELVKDTIKSDISRNTIVRDITIFFKDWEYAINQYGTFSKSMLESKILFNNKPLINYVNPYIYTINQEPGNIKIIRSETDITSYNIVLFSYSTENMVVFYWVDYEALMHAALNTALYEDGYTVIFDNNNELILRYGDTERIIEKLKNVLDNINGNKILLENNLYLINKNISSTTGWQYFTLYPYKTLKKEIGSLILIYKLLYITSFILIFFFVVVYRNAVLSPIEKLMGTLDHHSNGNRNEFGIIKDSLEKTRQENLQIHTFLNKNKEVIRRKLLESMLLNNTTISPIDIENYFSEFKKGIFFLFAVMCNFTVTDYKQKVKIFTENLNLKDTLIQEIMLNSNCLIYLINTDLPSYEITHYVNKALKEINKTQICFIACISSPVDGIKMLNFSWHQLNTILQYRNISNINECSIIDNAILKNKYQNKLEDIISKLDTAAKSGNPKTLETEMKKLSLQNGHVSALEATQILKTLINEAKEINEFAGVPNDKLPLDRYTQYLENNLLLDFFALEKKVFSYIKDSTIKIQKKNDVEDEIILYINKNFSKKLSLTALADEFHMNSTYLSTYIKDKVGISFIKYLNQLRFNEARKLLSTSSKSIREIAVEVCFENASSFTRFFTQMQGVSPANYRKKHFRG